MEKGLDRRKFLKIGGLVTPAAAMEYGLPLLPVVKSTAARESAWLSGPSWGMVIDVTKCPDDCTECVDACRKENNVAFYDDPNIDVHWIRKARIRRKHGNSKTITAPLLCNPC